MSKVSENKKTILLPVILALFFFLRGILLTDRRYIGIENMYTFEMAFSGESITLIVLLAIFSVLAALVISKIGKVFGETAKYISVLLVAEPLFFVKQDNCIVLFIAVLALLFILNALREKPVIPNEITLILFLLISTVLSENAIFLFVLPALIIYFIVGAENILKSTKRLVMLILSLVSVGAGIFLNDLLIRKYPAFDSFIKTYSYFENVYFKHIKYENILLFVFVIPTLVLGVYFLVEFVKQSKENGKTESYITVGAVTAAYVLSIVGFFLRGSEALFAVNYIVPATVLTLVKNKNSAAQSAMNKVNSAVSKHTLVFISAVVFLCFLAVRVFCEGIDNIADFLLTI